LLWVFICAYCILLPKQKNLQNQQSLNLDRTCTQLPTHSCCALSVETNPKNNEINNINLIVNYNKRNKEHTNYDK